MNNLNELIGKKFCCVTEDDGSQEECYICVDSVNEDGLLVANRTYIVMTLMEFDRDYVMYDYFKEPYYIRPKEFECLNPVGTEPMFVEISEEIYHNAVNDVMNFFKSDC